MYKRYAIAFFLFLTSTVFTSQIQAYSQASPVSDLVRLSNLSDRFYNDMMDFSPETGTFFSHPGCDHRWSDQSQEVIERHKKSVDEYLNELNHIDRSCLFGSAQLDYDTLKWMLEDGKALNSFPNEYLVLNQLENVQLSIAHVFSIMPKKTWADYQNLIARLRAAPLLIDQTISLLQKGLASGITPPKVILEDIPNHIKQIMTADPTDCYYYAAFKNFPETFSEAEKKALAEEAQGILTASVYPALQRLHDFLVEQYVPQARETIGLSALPNGYEWYQAVVRHFTTIDLTPKEIHALGLAEVSRILGEMHDILVTVQFEGTLAEFFDYLRSDPQFYFTERQDLIEGYRAIVQQAETQASKLFGRLPKMPCLVEPVPAHSEEFNTGAYYMLGSPKADRPGVFYANTSNLHARPKWSMEALALHEAVPGHHLQTALVMENDELPNFRKLTSFTGYVEGWGLYSEGLGRELGLYRDPYSYFGRLDCEIHRAVRLVVDTGIHAFGWSRQEAIDYFVANTGMGLHEIETEVDRYIAWPGQALAYKIGELKLLEMRHLAEQELGARFDIRAFHDEVLANGALPLSIFESHMRAWISRQ